MITDDARRKAAADLIKSLTELDDEAQGMMRIHVFEAVSLLPLLTAAMKQRVDDPQDALLVSLIGSVAREIFQPKLGLPPTCLTCTCTFTPTNTPPAAFIVLRAAAPDAKMNLVNMMCDSCFHQPDWSDRMMAYYRKYLFNGDMQVLPAGALHHEPGHA